MKTRGEKNNRSKNRTHRNPTRGLKEVSKFSSEHSSEWNSIRYIKQLRDKLHDVLGENRPSFLSAATAVQGRSNGCGACRPQVRKNKHYSENWAHISRFKGLTVVLKFRHMLLGELPPHRRLKFHSLYGLKQEVLGIISAEFSIWSHCSSV